MKRVTCPREFCAGSSHVTVCSQAASRQARSLDVVDNAERKITSCSDPAIGSASAEVQRPPAPRQLPIGVSSMAESRHCLEN